MQRDPPPAVKQPEDGSEIPLQAVEAWPVYLPAHKTLHPLGCFLVEREDVAAVEAPPQGIVEFQPIKGYPGLVGGEPPFVRAPERGVAGGPDELGLPYCHVARGAGRGIIPEIGHIAAGIESG